MDQFEKLIAEARHVREHMRECESIIRVTFPLHVRLEVALDAIAAGLASRCALETVVGYLMLRELVEAVRSEAPPPPRRT